MTGRDHVAERIPERIRQATRVRGYSPRTAKAYVGWVRRFRRFHRGRRLEEMGAPEINAFLTDLAVRKERERLHAEPGRTLTRAPVVRQ